MAGYEVLRCPKCEARVVFESDLSVSKGDSAKAARLFNLKQRSGYITCTRCGMRHYKEQDSAKLEDNCVQIRAGGRWVFKKTPLKFLAYVEATADMFYETTAEGKVIVNESMSGIQALNEISELSSHLLPEFSIIQRNVSCFQDIPLKPEISEFVKERIDFADFSCSQSFEWYSPLEVDDLVEDVFDQTYDVVLIMKIEENRFMHWTDFASIGTEEIVVMSWLCSGGNILFGQWGLPKDADGLYGETLDMDRIIAEQREGDITERQDSLAQLIEQGHFIGWWPKTNSFPQDVLDRIQAAMRNESYPQWLFKDRFPSETFHFAERRYGARSRVYKFQDPFHFVDTRPLPMPNEGFFQSMVDVMSRMFNQWLQKVDSLKSK